MVQQDGDDAWGSFQSVTTFGAQSAMKVVHGAERKETLGDSEPRKDRASAKTVESHSNKMSCQSGDEIG